MKKIQWNLSNKKRILIVLFFLVLLFLFLIYNGNTLKGFYSIDGYPGGEFAFLENGKCFAGVSGGATYKKDIGRSYVERPYTMDDSEACNDVYATWFNTVVIVNQGQWIGIHMGHKMFLIGTEKTDIEKMNTILDYPYYILTNVGLTREYPEQVLKEWGAVSNNKQREN